MTTEKLLWDGRSRKKQRCMKNLHNLTEDMIQLTLFWLSLLAEMKRHARSLMIIVNINYFLYQLTHKFVSLLSQARTRGSNKARREKPWNKV